MRRLAYVSALIAALIVPASGAATTAPATKKVRVGDDLAFHPSSLRIQRRAKVIWRWDGGATHNVTLTKGPKGVKRFHSRDQSSGTYSHVFTTAGTYTLMCTIHGFAMTIRVR
jgi:plastocyanin